MSEKKRRARPTGTQDGPTPRDSSTGPISPMDVGLLERIVRLMAANDLNTVDVRDGGKRVILKRGPAAQPFTFAAPVSQSGYAATAHSQPHPSGAAAPGPQGPPPGDDESKLVPIRSPMVGTFYAASSKGAKPFVTVGSQVEEETDVCIIEAMKVFNNIKAEARGTIVKVLGADGQPVEFGQTLFLVKPA